MGAPIIVSSGYGMDPIGFGMPGPMMPMIPGPSMVPGGAPATPPAPGAALGETLTPANPPPAAPQSDMAAANQATVVVTLPADARLYADGQLIDQAGPVRTFRTPPLEPGKAYYYMLSIEVTRGGRTQRSEERVQLEAGKVARVSFSETAPAAGNTAQLRIRVPEGASLVIEGQPVETTGNVAVIRTPALTSGQTHVYELKVEFTRQGQKQTMSREVSFRAGQEVRLVFDEPTSRLTGR
jgi:uncharacterized protein (TIGR03000 family)